MNLMKQSVMMYMMSTYMDPKSMLAPWVARLACQMKDVAHMRTQQPARMTDSRGWVATSWEGTVVFGLSMLSQS
jgi:hypothetical protein